MPLSPTPRHGRRARTAGFTIIELLIAVIIIGILVAIIVPVLANRANEARLAATRTDLDALQTAQQHAAIDTGYFYRLYVLDDVRDGDGVAPHLANDIVDGVQDEQFRGDVSNPTSLFIDTNSGQMLDAATAANKYRTMVDNETNFNWNGPYINVAKKSKTGIDAPPAGMPVDPYGQPYMLFTKEGLVQEPQGVITTQWNGYNAKVFDRPTVLSLGPDGVPGSGPAGGADAVFGRGDDLFRQF